MLALFVYPYIYVFVEPGARDMCSSSDIYLFITVIFLFFFFFLYVACVLMVVLSLFSMNCEARIENLNWASKLVKFSRGSIVDRFVRAGLILKLYILNRRSSSG